MLTRRHGRAAVIRLVVCPSLILLLVGCTGSSGQPSSAGTSAATEPAASATPAAGMCTRAEIKAAISRFFVVWNHRDAVALGWLFTADAVLEMATKHQDTLSRSEWTSVGGLGARPMIAAFAQRQWRLGEKLSHRGISVALNGGEAADGGYATIVARFADGTVQPMEESKFVYDCARHAFAHVVISSAKAAGPA